MKTLAMITTPLGVLGSVLAMLLVQNSAWSAESTSKQKVLPVPGELFMVEGHAAFLIPPAPDKLQTHSAIPWVWYAPTYINLPEERERWMIERFREAGIAVAGVDVGVSHVDRLAPLAKAKVPIFHIHGDVDALVPLDANSGTVASRYKELGGQMTLHIAKGQGHNYWSGFFECQELVDFVIAHIGSPPRKLPKVLLIGDSISGGYGAGVIKLLEGKAEMVKLGAVESYRINNEAFWHSRGIAKTLDFGSAKACVADFERFERHLSEAKYDVIHFNFGLNDIYRGRNGRWHNPPEQYAEYLDKIATLLQKNGAKIIWSNTTPIPDNDPDRPAGDDVIYNAAAEKVMKKHGIPINDLHGTVTRWDGYAGWKKGNDVHFSGAVYAMLAGKVADSILEKLSEAGMLAE